MNLHEGVACDAMTGFIIARIGSLFPREHPAAMTSKVIVPLGRPGHKRINAETRQLTEIVMSVTYLIIFDVKADQRDRFLSLLNGVLDAMRHEDKFINATLHRDPANELRFLLHETWADHQDVLDVQLKRSYRADWHAALDEILARPRDISVWETMRADHAPRRA